MRLFLVAVLFLGLLSLASATLVLAALRSPIGQGAMMGSGGMMGASGISNGGVGGTLVHPWLDLAGAFLTIVGTALVTVWAVQQVGNTQHHTDAEAPLLLLQRRYARGEIGPQDFNQMRADLLQDRGTA